MAGRTRAGVSTRIGRRKSGRDRLPAHEAGSGNVFDDIDLPNPGAELAKAKLAVAIVARMRSLGLTQTEAAIRLGIHQPRVSRIKCGRLGEFSIGTLLELALKLGIDLDIKLHEERKADASGRMRVHGQLAPV
jgi:predicted XRE-type DNA-binding protein